jgi:SAM-dependent methyltransferase
MDRHDNENLDAVYAAKGADEIARLYDGWAGTYEADMAKAGYRHPSIATALLARYLPRGAAPILDAGAGTGLAGEWLGILGYPQLEALDISEGMLAVARSKGVYSGFHKAALGDDLGLSAAHYRRRDLRGRSDDRACRRRGAAGVAGRDTTGRRAGSDRQGHGLDRGVRGGCRRSRMRSALRVLEATAPYISMPGEAGTAPSRAVVLERL